MMHRHLPLLLAALHVLPVSGAEPHFHLVDGPDAPFSLYNGGLDTLEMRPFLTDSDGDGDPDLIAGRRYYDNTGSLTTPGFTLRTGAQSPLPDLTWLTDGMAPELADPDGDGHQNLVEFAVSTSPVMFSTTPFTHTRTPAGLLQVAVTVRNNDPVQAALSARGEGSATLNGFSGNFAPAITDPIPGDGYALWTFTDQPPPDTNPRRFLRVVFEVN